MYAERHSVTVTTASDGTATAYSPYLTGRVHAVGYAKTDFADGVDFTITADVSGQSLWTDTNINASETVRPVLAASIGGTGAASTLTEVPVVLVNERVKIVIAAGGDTKTGTFSIVVF